MHQHAMTENLNYKLYDSNGDLLIDTTSLRLMMGIMNEVQRSIMDPGDYRSAS